MLGIRPHQDIKHTLLVSHLGELVTAHRDRHASRVHGWRSAAVEDRHAADALHYCVDFGLDCGLAWDEISYSAVICGKGGKAGLPLSASLLPSGLGPYEEFGDRRR
jgi:hypothetical protein